MQHKAVYLLFCKSLVSLATLEGGNCKKNCDQYRRLFLQFCVLMMKGVVDTRNMQSELAE